MNHLFKAKNISVLLISLVLLISSAIFYSQLNSTAHDFSPETSQFRCGDQVFDVEIARTPEERALGYMNRQEPLSNLEGMLFIFDKEDIRSFWMKNTYVSLDIIFMDSNFNVIKIHENTKTNQTSEVYPSELKSQYVLEIAAGGASKNRINLQTTCALL